MKRRTVTTLTPWFGSNRTLAENVGKALAGCRWVGIPFAGGMCELAHIDAPTLVVSDLHRWVINLAQVVADKTKRTRLVEMLDGTAFHPDQLKVSQSFCLSWDEEDRVENGDLVCAYHYFITAWMGRSAKAGTDDEFTGSLPVRWNANGGDSNTRYRSAIEALDDWGKVFRRCNFHVLDCFEFIAKVIDEPGNGLYCDPPFPDAGDPYKHKFDEFAHRRLAMECTGFAKCRVVMRFYRHELIEELYPKNVWQWHEFKGRKQNNADAPEILLVRN